MFNLPRLNYKKIVLLIILIVITITMLYGIIWLLFLRETGVDLDTPGSGNLGGILTPGGGGVVSPSGQLPDDSVVNTDIGDRVTGLPEIDYVANGSYTEVEKVADVEVRSLHVGKNGVSYLSLEDNKFYRLPIGGGDPILLSDDTFDFTDKVEWSPDGRKVVLEYPDGANIIYDFNKSKKVTLPMGLTDPEFTDDSERLAYKFYGNSEEDNWLVYSKSDGTSTVAVEPMGENGEKVQVEWSPNNTVMAIYHKSIGIESEELFLIGTKGENFKSIVVEGAKFEGIWSPKGDRLLYSTVHSNTGYRPSLWIVDAEGGRIGLNHFNLGLQTWVNKCVFSTDNVNIYCAVPSNLPEAAGLYPDVLNDSPDVFYKVNLKTGISELIAWPVEGADYDSEFQVKEIFTDTNSGSLYFLDAFSGNVYKLRLR